MLLRPVTAVMIAGYIEFENDLRNHNKNGSLSLPAFPKLRYSAHWITSLVFHLSIACKNVSRKILNEITYLINNCYPSIMLKQDTRVISIVLKDEILKHSHLIYFGVTS